MLLLQPACISVNMVQLQKVIGHILAPTLLHEQNNAKYHGICSHRRDSLTHIDVHWIYIFIKFDVRSYYENLSVHDTDSSF
jgi:hypothetical protein